MKISNCIDLLNVTLKDGISGKRADEIVSIVVEMLESLNHGLVE